MVKIQKIALLWLASITLGLFCCGNEFKWESYQIIVDKQPFVHLGTVATTSEQLAKGLRLYGLWQFNGVWSAGIEDSNNKTNFVISGNRTNDLGYEVLDIDYKNESIFLTKNGNG